MIDDGRPIFEQVAELLERQILDGSLPEEGQVPSTNELAAFHRINPATAAKGINALVTDQILYKKRGIGMFVSTGAREKLRDRRRSEFQRLYVEPLLAQAERLGIDTSHLIVMIKEGKVMSPDRDLATPMVEISHLTREFRGGVRAVDDVTLDVSTDSIVGLLGRNGAGKTTLMSLITAQDHPTSGQVRVHGEAPWENDRVLSQTCFIRESQVYPNNFKVGHVLAAGERFYPHWDKELAESLIEEFALPRRRQVAKLSRGMRSSVGILVGLASRAPLTIFDEPYLGLDATARQQFYDVLLKEYAEHPRTVVLSTHLIDEVAPLLQEVHVLHAGRLVMSGSAEDLTRRACVLTGPRAAVEELAGTDRVLHREPIGGYLALTLDRRTDADLLARAERAGVEVGPVSLQTLVVRAGLDRASTQIQGAS